MLCSNEESARKYMNYLARAIRVVTEYPGEYERLSTQFGVESLTKFVDDNLNIAFRLGENTLFEYLSTLIACLEDRRQEHRYVMARAAALWLDRQISYEIFGESTNTYSICKLVPFTTEGMVKIENLNDNEKTTGICIMPIFPAVKCFAFNKNSPDKPREKKIHVSGTLAGINNDLKNCRYRKYEDRTIVEHVIISWHKINTSHREYFRVAFTPLTDDKKLLTYTDETIPDKNGAIRRRVFGQPLQTSMLEERFRETLESATESGLEIDLIFGPEMLGTDKMYQEELDFLPYVQEALEKYDEDPDARPKIIVLPSRSKDRQNYCFVANSNGECLGKQIKMYPFTDEKDHYEEALDNNEKLRVMVIHIPDHERIVIMICKDFLKADSELHDLVFKHINPTLVIVPSYTLGETAFTSSIATFRRYGTSVVWGTCCGAPKAMDPYIGAACAFCVDGIPKMSDGCKCGGTCEKYKACMFYIDLPLKAEDRMKGNIEFKHHCV